MNIAHTIAYSFIALVAVMSIAAQTALFTGAGLA
jgi:hypothetical protein